MSMHDDDRHSRRLQARSRWGEDDDLVPDRDSRDLRGRGRMARSSSYGYGGEMSGQGAGMGRPSQGRSWDDDYGDRRSRGGWYGTRDRYTSAERRGGAYGDDAMPSGGSIPRGGGYGGESMGRTTRGAIAGGLGGTVPGDSGGGRIGRMAGKGPKGYTRPDQRIWEDVCDRLTDDRHLDASSIEVQVEKGDVTLDGTVQSRNAKRYAEGLIDRISGVRRVLNNLRVEAGRAPNADVGPTS